MPARGFESLQRGRVYRAQLRHLDDQKYYLVVSNNRRNSQLGEVLAVRLTTTPKPALPSIVELSRRDGPFVGRAVCDDIYPLWPDEVTADLGALSRPAMARIGDGLRAALDLL